MVEIEHIQDIEKDQPAKSSAKEQKLKDPKDLTTETQDTDASEATEHDEQIENQEDNIREDSTLVNHNTDVHDLKPGNRFQVLVSSLNFIFLYVRIAGVQLKIL